MRFIRQPTRLFGSLAQPLMFWFFMGSGFAGSFSDGLSEQDYAEFFYPGIVLMLLLFAAIFSTITLIEDRNAGFLQGVLVAPVSRLSVALGKLAGGTLIALFQSGIFLFLAPLAGIDIDLTMILLLIGIIVAWKLDSTAGYHAVMSVVMLPMWLLSGALFPVEGAASWLEWVMFFNPVTYAMVILRQAFYLTPSQLLADAEFVRALIVSAGWTVLMVAGSAWMVARSRGA
jgi:ABC-2 type transport system permease protein